MIVLTRADFVGRFEITFPSINNRGQIVEDELASFEKEELVKLFGVDRFTLFAANPTDSIYDDLYTPLLRCSNYSEGLKSVLLSFVYLRYQRLNYAMSTENGRVLKDSSTSTPARNYSADMKIYNSAVKGWRAIQSYCGENFDDYSGVKTALQFY